MEAMRAKAEKPPIPVPIKHNRFAMSYRWGYEAALAGKPMPRTAAFSYVEQYEAWRDGHVAGEAARTETEKAELVH